MERVDLGGKLLCDRCAEHAKDASAISSRLSEYLLEWGKHQEWAGASTEVMLQAMEMATNDFELRLRSGRPIAEGPHVAGDGDG